MEETHDIRKQERLKIQELQNVLTKMHTFRLHSFIYQIVSKGYMSMRQIGDCLGLTNMRISQIVAKMRKLDKEGDKWKTK